MEKASERNFKKLSTKQQVGMYVILTKLRGDKNRPFSSLDFAEKMKPLIPVTDPSEYQRAIGGILGALSKNSLIEKISKDLNPLWMLPEDIHKNGEKYKKDIFPVYTYWEK